MSPARRAGYAITGLVLGTIVNLGNWLILANIPILSGATGNYVPQTTLLTGIYIAFNAAGNLILVKGRIQFGIPKITLATLSAYLVAALTLFVFPSFTSAVLLSALSGLTAAGLTTLALYYFMQSLRGPAKPLGLAIGVSVVQLSPPLARLVPVESVCAGRLGGAGPDPASHLAHGYRDHCRLSASTH